ncbi:MAG: hypothetical protein QM704_05550 [Anaeromyxobacteraceae bacterium]
MAPWVLAVALSACSHEPDPAPADGDPGPDPVTVVLSLERLDPELTNATTYGVVVHASPDLPVSIELDGVAVAAGRDLQVVRAPIDAAVSGTHALVAVARIDGERFESAPLAFRVDRTPPSLVALSPDIGVALPPVDVIATFGEPVTLVKAEMLVSGAAVYEPPSSLSADGLTVRVTLGWFMWKATNVRLVVKDALGNAGTYLLGPWLPGPLEVELSGVPAGPLRGTVPFSVRWRGPALLDVLVGGIGFATLQAPAGQDGWREGQAEIDTRGVPDGPATVRLYYDGYESHYQQWTIDNTPPALVSCGPLAGRADDAPTGAGVVARFAEPVTPVAAPGPLAKELVLVEKVQEPLPYTWRGEIPQVRDAAGNIVGPLPCGEVIFPVWRAPAGAGPIAVGPLGPALRLFAAGDGVSVEFASLDDGVASFIHGGYPLVYPPPPEPIYAWGGAGTIQSSSIVVGTRAAAWVFAADFASSLTVRTAPYVAEEYVGVTAAARFPQRAVAVAEDGGVAWTDGGAGARVLRASWRQPIRRATLDAGMDPAAEVEGGALAAGATRLAWLERAPGGPALLFLREAAGSPLAFGPTLGPLNADPAATAAEPVLLASALVDAVAWTEVGQVLIRTRAPGQVDYGPAVVANADPARLARTPSLAVDADGAVLAFVEATPTGDRMEVRRWRGGAWVLDGGLEGSLEGLDLGASGAEVSIAWPGVLWRSAGETRVRVRNR